VRLVKWASAISDLEGAPAALEKVASAVEAELGRPDLAVLFASIAHARAHEGIPELLRKRWPAATVVGCSGGGIIGGAHEIEDRPALSLTAAVLPGVSMRSFHVDIVEMPEPSQADAWRHAVGADGPTALMVLADPFTCDTQALISGLDAAWPSAAKFGGLASGGRGAGQNRLYHLGQTLRSGAVGVAFSGDVHVDTVVAQGCRPVGAPMMVTRARGSVIHELDGRPPMEVLQALYQSLSEADRELFRHSLFMGVEMQDTVVHREGELLVRNLAGIESESGGLAVAAALKPFQVVQFLLRDKRTAEEDLTRHLERYRERQPSRVEGALLFSCLGRGEQLFGRPDHDSALFQKLVGQVPLGGFFCNGEIGPVGGTTFLHGYTSAFALFRARR